MVEIMIPARTFSWIVLVLFLFITFYPLHEASTTPSTNQRIVPFIGMKVDYILDVIITGITPIPIPVTANWTVTWEQYNQSYTDIFYANLTVQSTYFTLFGFLSHETGIIIENITSRQVVEVHLENSTFLQLLYGLYFPVDKPNYTPFYIDTAGLHINDQINIYNYSMTVTADDRVRVADLGYRNVWVVQNNVSTSTFAHFMSFIYDNTSGVLVGGRMNSQNFVTEREYDIEIICRNTNVLTRHLVIIEVNELLAILVACIPIIPVFVKIIRIKEIKGGL